jgi:hypothetical protein
VFLSMENSLNRVIDLTSKERQFDPKITPGVFCAVLWRFWAFFGARKTFETQRRGQRKILGVRESPSYFLGEKS